MCRADPFLEPTGNVSDAFANEITPSGWTFIIWTIIYIFLALVCVYTLAGFFRKWVPFFFKISTLCPLCARLWQTRPPVHVVSIGTLMATSTAALLFYHTGSLQPGA